MSALCRCGRAAMCEIRYGNTARLPDLDPGYAPQWEPHCDRCVAESQRECNAVAAHELRSFGGAYGVPFIERRPLSIDAEILPAPRALLPESSR